ncbi:Hypothetical_protein [Hexamita inflata]|uniref:Hypothetical_protein n=1 Tax=Hexamita inflata TaxID=28002 RepID=A0AA86V1V8_9EUKA|nr:Hypothetical protein HINF_LOCUS60676 [Hexamita inflata]
MLLIFDFQKILKQRYRNPIFCNKNRKTFDLVLELLYHLRLVYLRVEQLFSLLFSAVGPKKVLKVILSGSTLILKILPIIYDQVIFQINLSILKGFDRVRKDYFIVFYVQKSKFKISKCAYSRYVVILQVKPLQISQICQFTNILNTIEPQIQFNQLSHVENISQFIIQ